MWSESPHHLLQFYWFIQYFPPPVDLLWLNVVLHEIAARHIFKVIAIKSVYFLYGRWWFSEGFTALLLRTNLIAYFCEIINKFSKYIKQGSSGALKQRFCAWTEIKCLILLSMSRDSLFISLVMLVTVSIWVAWAVSGLTIPTPHQVKSPHEQHLGGLGSVRPHHSHSPPCTECVCAASGWPGQCPA